MVTTKIALFRTIVNKRIFYSVVKFFSTLLGALKPKTVRIIHLYNCVYTSFI